MPTPTATRTFGPADLDRLRDAHPEVRVIDVRTPSEFASGHLSGSYNVPLPDLSEHRRELRSGVAGPVVLICQSGRRAGTAAERLHAAGLDNVHVLDGGVAAWEASGRELVRLTTSAWTIERQVRLAAGAVVVAATVASVWWPPARFAAGALGAGLVTAALTDTCMMGNLLGRLPFNRRPADACDLPTLVATIAEPDRRTSSSNGEVAK